VDHVTVWLLKPGGYQNRACDYWTHASSHPGSWNWGHGIYSARLARAFEFILENQERFRQAENSISWRVIVVFPPEQETRAKAENWTASVAEDFHSAGAKRA
jgi:hypothetical protein